MHGNGKKKNVEQSPVSSMRNATSLLESSSLTNELSVEGTMSAVKLPLGLISPAYQRSGTLLPGKGAPFQSLKGGTVGFSPMAGTANTRKSHTPTNWSVGKDYNLKDTSMIGEESEGKEMLERV